MKAPRKYFSGKGSNYPWPPIIKMDEAVKAKVEKILAMGR